MGITTDIGNIGEDAVVRYLESEGFRILVRNFTVHNVGELDIVAVKGDDVYIVEVKTRAARHTNDYGAPETFISTSKMRKIKNSIRYLTARYNLYDKNMVIAAGSVLHDGKGNITSVELIEL